MKFRNMFLGSVLMMLGFAQASAQSVRFGVEGGLSIASLRGDLSTVSTNLGSRTGLIGGLFLQLNVSDTFAVQPELLYSQKGSGITVPGASGSMDLSYLEVPLLLKLYLPTPQVKPNIFFGGSVGFNVLAQASSGGASVPLTGVNSTETSLIAGAGVDIDKFSLSGRYQIGLSNIGTTNVQNGVIAFMVGYSFI